MNSIVYVGMDVHKEQYTICCYSYETDKVEYKQTIPSDYKLVLKYMEQVRSRYDGEVTFVCGYEAGCLGYSLYHQLKEHAVDCKILAPSTMAVTNTHHVKTDKRDAANIARCLAFHTYSEVYVPDNDDNDVKEYIRMRDDQKLYLKKVKQQILAFVLRQGKRFEGGKTYWTIAHLKWLKHLELDMRYIIETTITDAGTRVLPITEDVAQMFQAIIEDRNAPKVEKAIDGYSGFLFYDDNGMPLVAMHWQHRFNHMVGRYNDIYRVQMPNITPHVCRHTYCSNMAKSGMNPKTLQYLMGHSDISVTMNVYTHIGFDDAEEELKRMEDFRKAQAEIEKKSEKPMSQKMFKAI